VIPLFSGAYLRLAEGRKTTESGDGSPPEAEAFAKIMYKIYFKNMFWRCKMHKR